MAQKTEIIIHCSDTPAEWWADRGVEEQRDEFRRWHVEERGWDDIGYAAILGRKGDRALGRDLDGDGDVFEEIGAHVRGRNTRSIGICLVGGRGSSATDAFSDHFTPEQDAALRLEIERIKAWAEVRGDKITRIAGHNEFAAKACPGFNVERWLKGAPPKKESLAESSTVGAATIAGLGGAVQAIGPVVGGLHPIVQGIAVVAIIAGAVWIIRERAKKFAAGDR